jgi:hypothetical protein
MFNMDSISIDITLQETHADSCERFGDKAAAHVHREIASWLWTARALHIRNDEVRAKCALEHADALNAMIEQGVGA